jgi:hypothetical protein
MVKYGCGFPVAFCHFFDGGKDTAGWQNRALGERGDSNVATSADRARFRSDFAGEHRQQCGLSRSVEANDA